MSGGYTGQRNESHSVQDRMGGLDISSGMQFKTYEFVYFWNFPFNVFEPKLTVDN
jgi:hypothetical protein